ncbi:MAG: L-threonylcarbamoyladenylate synthase [Thermoplasmata archaeon]|nr:L-threonylcarbamoyladenylate synthase [Thermoplasmata archaeon]
METKIYRVSPTRPAAWKIKECAQILKTGGLVGFPTETVYGLGASAFLDAAVKRIFEVKGRPADNPVIVHISNLSQLESVVSEMPEKARKLAEKFWPGPLTLVLSKGDKIPSSVTANLDTVAVRMPSHAVARMLIELAGPVAAPSANISGRVSPTKAEHVIADFYGKIEAIIDGGNTEIGLESTVVGNLDGVPLLLRPGGITVEMLTRAVGKVEIHPAARAEIEFAHAVAPGMKYRHYSPAASVVLVEPSASGRIFEVFEAKKNAKKTCLLLFRNRGKSAEDVIVGSRGTKEEYARNLFRLLREVDKRGYELVVVEGVDEEGIGLAIMNRLRKCASEILR